MDVCRAWLEWQEREWRVSRAHLENLIWFVEWMEGLYWQGERHELVVTVDMVELQIYD